ncbi:MAG: hypothetical protein MUC96_30885 [Myxococcaceae bacterium]|jgi:hypothetical protein|nr:hypothetical protein [Myxococcaceae bacterium]
MRLLTTLLCLSLAACFVAPEEPLTPGPSEPTTPLNPTQPAAPDAGPGTPVDAGVTPMVPPTPITAVVDALAPNPPAIATDTDQRDIDGGCRGDAYQRGLRRPAECAPGAGPCLGVVGRDGAMRVLDRGQSVWTVGADGDRVAWLRSEGPGRRRTLLVATGTAAPRELTTNEEGLVEVRFDGEDVLVVVSVSSGGRGRTTITRYVGGQGRPQSVYEAPGTTQYRGSGDGEGQLQLDATTGRLWVLTSDGLFRTAPRGQTGGAAVPVVNGPRGSSVSAFALAPGGLAFVAVENEVWLSDGTLARLDHVASLPPTASISAIAPFGTGFAAVASGSVYVLEGAGPIRRILGRSDVSPYGTTEGAIAVSGRRIFVNTLCLSWSSYPGYDIAVLEPDAAQPTARWWWDVYGSQHDLPAIPSSRVNVSGNSWSSVELVRGLGGFVTTVY